MMELVKLVCAFIDPTKAAKIFGSDTMEVEDSGGDLVEHILAVDDAAIQQELLSQVLNSVKDVVPAVDVMRDETEQNKLFKAPLTDEQRRSFLPHLFGGTDNS